MGQPWSKEWVQFSINFSAASIGYSWTFYSVFRALIRNAEIDSEVTALNYATCTISVINSIITTFCGFLNIFLNYKSLVKYAVINNQKDTFLQIPFFTYSYFIAYLFVDAFAHLIVCKKYGFSKISKNKVLQVLIHHFLVSFQFIAIQVPKPIYVWPLYSLVLIMETSTIPLNFKWFATYFKWNKTRRTFIDFCFIFTWFGARIPALFLILAITILIWDEVVAKLPRSKLIIGALLLALGFLPQLFWTGLIVKNIYKIKRHNNVKNTVVHGQKLKTFNN